MIALLEFAAIVLFGASILFGTLSWIKEKRPRWRDVSAFVVATAAAYSASFVLDMFTGACVGVYSFSPFALPVFAWSGIAIVLYLFARYVSVRRVWIGVPYLAFGGLAIIGGLLSPHKYDIGVGLPLILFAIFFILRASALRPGRDFENR